MTFGSFSENRQQPPMADINVTPMVNVMLVLLVIFIMAAPLFTHAVRLEAPVVTAVPVPGPLPTLEKSREHAQEQRQAEAAAAAAAAAQAEQKIRAQPGQLILSPALTLMPARGR